MTKLRELPQDPTARKNVINNIKEFVDAMLEEQAAKDLQTSVKETVKDKYGIDPSWFSSMCKIEFDLRYNEGKAAEKIEDNYELLELVREIREK